jgi:hypothetical protein
VRRRSRRARLAPAAGAAVLLALGAAGCPLPQPLAEVNRIDGGTVTPPRVVVETARPADTRLLVPLAGCPGVQLSASVDDVDTVELVEARWFVDYDPATAFGIADNDLPQALPPETRRPVRPFTFDVPPFDPATPLHVVELVVSNGFAPGTAPPRNRAPLPGFEIQVFRWAFGYAATGRCPP